jgi:hypothetical protein
MDSQGAPKRRRIIADDEDDDVADHGSVGSNPDELIDENVDDPDDEEGEDLEENWLEYVFDVIGGCCRFHAVPPCPF